MCALLQRPRSAFVCLQATAGVVMIKIVSSVASGRAGRDRLPAESRVYFCEEDLGRFQFLVFALCCSLGCTCNLVRQYCWLTRCWVGRSRRSRV